MESPKEIGQRIADRATGELEMWLMFDAPFSEVIDVYIVPPPDDFDDVPF